MYFVEFNLFLLDTHKFIVAYENDIGILRSGR